VYKELEDEGFLKYGVCLQLRPLLKINSLSLKQTIGLGMDAQASLAAGIGQSKKVAWHRECNVTVTPRFAKGCMRGLMNCLKKLPLWASMEGRIY
jgi:hypothetical protein